MKKSVMIVLLVILFLQACSQSNTITGNIAAEIPSVEQDTKQIEPPQIIEQADNLPQRTFKIEDLQYFLRTKLRDPKDPFETKVTGPYTVYLSNSKSWGIYLINRRSSYLNWKKVNELSTEEVLKYYEHKKELNPRLTKEELYDAFNDDKTRSGDTEHLNYYMYRYNYDDYIKDSTLVSEDVYEESIATPRGTIVEYRRTRAIVNEDDIWQGEWEPPMLMYKLPCTEDTVIFFRPESEFHRLSTANMKRENVLNSWKELTRNDQKDKLFDEVMGFCGVPLEKRNDVIKSQKHNEYAENDIVYYKHFLSSALTAQAASQSIKNETAITELTMSLRLSGKKIGNNVRMHVFSNESGQVNSYNDWTLKKDEENNETETYKTIITTGLPKLTGENITLIIVPYFHKQKNIEDAAAAWTYDYGHPEDYTIGEPFYLNVR
ncbi:MAG TPA: hypothetical protein VJB66_00400 [Candidatus Nanoarchaeia archaeon]|nr:hypothetical protein [Candidatus Nanoarchaeia archaeon]